jgi:hypothetical protein
MTREKQYGTSKLEMSAADLVPRAQDIAIDRGRTIVESTCYMAAIRGIQPESSHSGSQGVVTCCRATVQNVNASGGQQAAHLLPGQISVNGTNVWELADNRFAPSIAASELLRLQLQTKLTFARTNVLPAEFNRADTEAEGTGSSTDFRLKHEFGRAIGGLWKNARSGPSGIVTLDRDAVVESLRHWFAAANVAYEMAAQRKAERAATASGLARARREAELRVLETYANSFDVKNVSRFLHSNVATVFMKYRRI